MATPFDACEFFTTFLHWETAQLALFQYLRKFS